MRNSPKGKAGLADLKRLRAQAEEQARLATPPPAARKAKAAVPGGARPATDASRHTLEPGERALFLQAVGAAQRLKPPGKAVMAPAPKAPADILRQRRQAAVGTDAPPPPTVSDQFQAVQLDANTDSYTQPGHGSDLVKGLRRGKWPMDASLDLHGATLEQARSRLDHFIETCLSHGVRCVRIVHGKGLGSRGQDPVLPQNVRRWLAQMACVMAFVQCAERDGGAGAVQVLLKLPAAE